MTISQWEAAGYTLLSLTQTPFLALGSESSTFPQKCGERKLSVPFVIIIAHDNSHTGSVKVP